MAERGMEISEGFSGTGNPIPGCDGREVYSGQDSGQC